ncbi:restriction endonuclease subunit M [Salegentibacter salinarum]|uniref:site-specific DNA-methyltransferase (adenine-specific) n=1 Tax=Salegentibacter salinarum TaxID=447422 RepID=A0A2N0U474_9FLAO|nr:DNA methyltransferase [Salegentibacter salinarum]PKD21807.1 restriction endonuclease subunit M [Salegentibacter salinarum]SKB33437.1 Methyltransferase domain-containing protein [Salegentibacter salinarum]
MALFQTSVLKSYLAQLDDSAVEKAFKKYQKYFWNTSIQENIKKAKEEQYQATFLNELFVNILGYTLFPNPDSNLTTEFKNEKNARKADGAILKEDSAIGVIELKGTNTKDLESIRKQAFDYKANNNECVYVVTSNFEKLRFYIKDATEFEEFDLFSLTKEKFNLLYLCLQKDKVLNNIPLKVKEASIAEEEEITKKFYKDYSLFKRELYRDLIKNNSKTVKNKLSQIENIEDHEDVLRLEKNVRKTLFKKSQKLIDRFLFIFFAEDRMLLPSNSTRQILNKWKDDWDFGDERPLYDLFKQYFNFLDGGRKGTEKRAEIYAYNGGLFKTDYILDALEIDNDLLYKHTLNLSNYDFESQVDVNILGHIFENSLNEIESINAEIEGGDFDKQSTKRKKDGVFYTPKYITKYIVENTIGKLCNEKKKELGFDEEQYFKGRKNRNKSTIEKLVQILDNYRDWLLQITICDPACGSGAFLNQALDFLIKEHKYIDELKAKVLGGGLQFPDIENTILENNIYGVDLNEESVEIAKLSLWLRTAQPRRKLNDLSSNIKCGNSLIENKALAGNKAFTWDQEFTDIFEKGGFDVVIGNPPYVRAELLSDFIPYFEKNYKVFHPASDLFAYFYELGSNLINENGLMGYISNTFDKTTAGNVLRNYLNTETRFQEYIDFTEVQIFDGATTYPVIIILDKKDSKSNKFKYIKIPKSSQNSVVNIEVHQSIDVLQESLNVSSWSFLSAEKGKLFRKLASLKTVKEIFGKSYRGLITGLNEAFIIQEDICNKNHIKPIFEGKEIKKWSTQEATQNLILFESKWTNEVYPNLETEDDKLKSLKNDYPKIFKNLTPFIEPAKKRYDKGDYWWELRNCAYYDLFEMPKIIFPNLQNSNKFCLDTKGTYVNAPAVFLPSDNRTLLCVLNSKVVWEFLKSICVVRSGGYIEVKPQYFEQIPIPEFKNEEYFTEATDKIMSNVNDLQILKNRFQNYFKSVLHLNRLQRKLENWNDLDFSTFIKELNKAIKSANKIRTKENLDPITTLTKKDEFEWMELFEENKKKAQDLQAHIYNTEHEIDQMVYGLYGLTEEEIKIVEAS